MDISKFDKFTQAYIEALFFTEEGEPRTGDGIGDATEFAPETLEKIHADCKKFQEEHGDIISGSPSQAGHDFWLTRNRHGSGFWDPGRWPLVIWPQGVTEGEYLTEKSHEFGEVNAYLGDDGLIYLEG